MVLWLNNSCLSPQYSFPGSVVLPMSPDIACLRPVTSCPPASLPTGPKVAGDLPLVCWELPPWGLLWNGNGFQSTRRNDTTGFGVHWNHLFLPDLLFLLLRAQCPSFRPLGLQTSGAFFMSLCPGFFLQGAKYFEFTSAPFISHCPSPRPQPLTGPLALTGLSRHCTTSYPHKAELWCCQYPSLRNHPWSPTL